MREQRQQEAVQAFLNSDRKSIVNACPRFGKIKVALDIIKEMDINHIWILAPRVDIFDGWDSDIKKFGGPTVIGESTYRSIHKLTHDVLPKLIILDEPHEMSVNQQKSMGNWTEKHPDIPILGLTGTLTQKTRTELYDNLTLDVCYKYTISQGVSEGILTDYQLVIHKVPLDDREYVYGTKKKRYSEQGYFNLCEYLKKEAKDSNSKHHMNLKMIGIIQNSIAKMEKTRKLINEHKDERLLVFCGVTDIADQLGIPAYHSKNREKELFDDFCAGIGNHLVTIKMMQAGITVTPIHMGIINYMSGNPEDSAQKICRFLGLEYGNLEKKAIIHIISTKEDFEQTRLKTGLQFFEQEKIKYESVNH